MYCTDGASCCRITMYIYINASGEQLHAVLCSRKSFILINIYVQASLIDRAKRRYLHKFYQKATSGGPEMVVCEMIFAYRADMGAGLGKQVDAHQFSAEWEPCILRNREQAQVCPAEQ